jgi:hypothetical protein
MQFFQIKITLKDIKPLIWRRIIVTPEIKLNKLHDVLQIVMGWTNSHLYQFKTPLGDIADPAFELEETKSSKKTTLQSVLPGPNSHIIYEYDFGDSWEHQILLETVLERDETAIALCLEGTRACLPEDCGGPWDYADLCTILKNPKHPEYKSMNNWLGSRFDPEAFDVEAINKRLARLAPRPKKASAKKAAGRSAKQSLFPDE